MPNDSLVQAKDTMNTAQSVVAKDVDPTGDSTAPVEEKKGLWSIFLLAFAGVS